MTLTRGRVIRRADVTTALSPPASGRLATTVKAAAGEAATGAARGARRVARSELLAKEQARATVEERAAAAEAQARAAEEARWVAHFLKLHVETEARAEADLDRAVNLAVILAQRLLGETLTLTPERIVDLARQALVEARGARRIVLRAHPEDAALLGEHLATLAPPAGTLTVEEDATLTRGELTLETDVGTLHGKLRPRLARLAVALRDALRGSV